MYPFIIYVLHVWGLASDGNTEPVNILQKRIVRQVMNILIRMELVYILPLYSMEQEFIKYVTSIKFKLLNLFLLL